MTSHRAHAVGSHRLMVAVVAPSGDVHALDTLVNAGEYDVMLIDSMDSAYSRIRSAQPDVVIMFLTPRDEVAGCHVLSMLSTDRETTHIPRLTVLAEAVSPLEHRGFQEPDRLGTRGPLQFSMN